MTPEDRAFGAVVSDDLQVDGLGHAEEQKMANLSICRSPEMRKATKFCWKMRIYLAERIRIQVPVKNIGR